MYAVSICPEFRKENTKTGILLEQKDCVFLLTELILYQFTLLMNSIPMPCDPSTIDATPWLRDVI